MKDVKLCSQCAYKTTGFDMEEKIPPCSARPEARTLADAREGCQGRNHKPVA